jgi:hypothetical protein
VSQYIGLTGIHNRAGLDRPPATAMSGRSLLNRFKREAFLGLLYDFELQLAETSVHGELHYFVYIFVTCSWITLIDDYRIKGLEPHELCILVHLPLLILKEGLDLPGNQEGWMAGGMQATFAVITTSSPSCPSPDFHRFPRDTVIQKAI